MAQVIPLRDRQVADAGRCQAVTSSGKQCRNRAVAESGFCRVHLPPAPERVGPFSAQTVQEFRDFDFMSPWEGAPHILPGDEKAGKS